MQRKYIKIHIKISA